MAWTDEFTDLSHEEFMAVYPGLRTDLPKKKDARSTFRYEDAMELPKSVDRS